MVNWAIRSIEPSLKNIEWLNNHSIFSSEMVTKLGKINIQRYINGREVGDFSHDITA